MVWKPDSTFDDALRDIQTACERINAASAEINLKILHCMVLDTVRWAGIPDPV